MDTVRQARSGDSIWGNEGTVPDLSANTHPPLWSRQDMRRK